MKLVRWDPFQELVSAGERLNRKVNHSYSNRIEDSFGPWAPPVDILERNDHPVIRPEVLDPSFKAAQLLDRQTEVRLEAQMTVARLAILNLTRNRAVASSCSPKTPAA